MISLFVWRNTRRNFTRFRGRPLMLIDVILLLQFLVQESALSLRFFKLLLQAQQNIPQCSNFKLLLIIFLLLLQQFDFLGEHFIFALSLIFLHKFLQILVFNTEDLLLFFYLGYTSRSLLIPSFFNSCEKLLHILSLLAQILLQNGQILDNIPNCNIWIDCKGLEWNISQWVGAVPSPKPSFNSLSLKSVTRLDHNRISHRQMSYGASKLRTNQLQFCAVIHIRHLLVHER